MNFAWLKRMSFCVILDHQGEGGKELRKQYSGLNHKQKQYKPTESITTGKFLQLKLLNRKPPSNTLIQYALSPACSCRHTLRYVTLTTQITVFHQ